MLELLSALFSLKTVLLGVTVCLVSLWLLRKRKYNLPPGTYPFPLFGNIFRKFKLNHTGSIFKSVLKCFMDYLFGLIAYLDYGYP